jgi:16S rRNA processing protein RimM
MKGMLIEVDRADAVELEEGEYFIEELKGLTVYDTSSERICRLKDIMQTGAVDVIVFDCEGKELMMPYLKEYVSEVNIKGGYMKADLSKGISDDFSCVDDLQRFDSRICEDGSDRARGQLRRTGYPFV